MGVKGEGKGFWGLTGGRGVKFDMGDFHVEAGARPKIPHR